MFHLKLLNTMIHIGYAQTFEEAYEALANLYKEDEVVHENPPVEDFLLWRDLRVFDGKKAYPPCFCSLIISTISVEVLILFEKHQEYVIVLTNVCYTYHAY